MRDMILRALLAAMRGREGAPQMPDSLAVKWMPTIEDIADAFGPLLAGGAAARAVTWREVVSASYQIEKLHPFFRGTFEQLDKHLADALGHTRDDYGAGRISVARTLVERARRELTAMCALGVVGTWPLQTSEGLAETTDPGETAAYREGAALAEKVRAGRGDAAPAHEDWNAFVCAFLLWSETTFGDRPASGKKLVEEAGEVRAAIEAGESEERIAEEIADTIMAALNAARSRRLDLLAALWSKFAVNRTRPWDKATGQRADKAPAPVEAGAMCAICDTVGLCRGVEGFMVCVDPSACRKAYRQRREKVSAPDGIRAQAERLVREVLDRGIACDASIEAVEAALRDADAAAYKRGLAESAVASPRSDLGGKETP